MRASTRRSPTTATARAHTISEIGSQVGGAPVLPILVGVIGLACAIARRWRIAAFAVFVLLAESATYRVTTLVVPRDRPSVHRLESLPVDASYPSGHTAASVAVYSGLVLLLTTRFTSSLSKALAWTGAILLTTFVALSRMYRGMHHPLDVAGGVLVGIGAIIVLLFACRAAGAAAERRLRAHEAGGHRACRQDARRRALGVAAHARGARASPRRCGSRCRRASGRRARSSGRWRTAPS